MAQLQKRNRLSPDETRIFDKGKLEFVFERQVLIF